ncbi:MAG: N-6 DNA methylase [Leptolyngbyaceae cyanobacterium CSU_1_3]|nr:N-6 DNA methylase [Leptolyngbyaceae cyanobacterium CSU_1_3]
MGDIFEELLKGIQSAGKNGQFRTPRHIIRFMIHLLKPEIGKYVLDPTSGTGGFLINAIQYLSAENTEQDKIRYEWDGTPHRADAKKLDETEREKLYSGDYFVGFDNDRTMVRIAWMNMILHGIQNPKIVRFDTLGQSLANGESGKYHYIFANPPYTGSIDKGDLHKTRIPRDPRKAEDPITTKSELLFVWLILDLLAKDGRAAVIVPEGVLFGSTTAHRELRRQLLFENQLEGVISLPGGIFLPYTGVKTSILVFQKKGELPADLQPHTKQVWFYEIEADGYTLDAKRNEKREANDLWDALEKLSSESIDESIYHQPQYYVERWRLIDKDCIKIFPELAAQEGQTLGIHERFADLP